MARLIITQGAVDEEKPTTIKVPEGEFSIGRSRENDLVLEEPSVSRHHAVIVRSAVGTVLRDLGSANGTFINKRRITEEPLHDGDTILLGRAELRFEAPEAVPAATVRMDVTDRAQPAPQAPSPPPSMPSPPAAAPPPPAPPPPVAPPSANLPPPAPAAPPPTAAPRPDFSPSPPMVQATPGGVEYAGFWPRLLAYLVDGLIIFIAELIVMIPMGLVVRLLGRRAPGLAGLVLALGYLVIAIFGIWYLLHFWASSGATPGKKLLHLKIVREDGVEPMGYGTAALRLLGYVVSSIIFCIGYLMIAFTDRKRGLHDMIAKTVVIKAP